MAITSIIENVNRNWYRLQITATAVNDFYDIRLPRPIREYTIQRALVGPSASTVLLLGSNSFSDEPPTVVFFSLTTDALSGSTSAVLGQRLRIKINSFTGAGNVHVSLVGRMTR